MNDKHELRFLRGHQVLGIAAVSLALACVAPCAAQGSAAPSGPGAGRAAAPGYSAAVNANNVFVRSSPSVNSSYPFAKLANGDVVDVIEESYGWARVRCTGPAFASVFGYVPADKRVELASDGSSLRVTAKTEIKAPNIGSKESPDSSWKPIAKLSPGDTLRVVGVVEGDREKVYKVALTEAAEGYVNLNYLRRASPAEVSAYQAAGASRPAPDANAMTPPVGGPPASDLTTRTPPTAPPSGNVPAPTVKPISDGEAPNSAFVEIDSASIKLPDGTTETVERDTIVTRSRSEAPAAPALSPREIESAANRSEFEDLESIWEAVRAQPIESAELAVLRQRYADMITRTNVPGEVRQMAQARTEQLGLQLEIQERIHVLDRMKAQRTTDLDRIQAIKLAMEARSDYDAVGILNASTVFDGNRLPALYRLQDPGVGQTVAYVAPRDDFQLATMLGVLVGIKGEKRYDSPLRVNVIEPRSVDILTQRSNPQATPAVTPGSVTVVDVEVTEASPATAPASDEPVYYAPVPPDAR